MSMTCFPAREAWDWSHSAAARNSPRFSRSTDRRSRPKKMPIPRYKIFSPTDAARVSKLQLTARQVVEGIITGLHKSPHRGFSVEFSEHREYVAGDELRHLDWRAFARSDRYYIKLYEQETNLRATIVLDTSASMRFA